MRRGDATRDFLFSLTRETRLPKKEGHEQTQITNKCLCRHGATLDIRYPETVYAHTTVQSESSVDTATRLARDTRDARK